MQHSNLSTDRMQSIWKELIELIPAIQVAVHKVTLKHQLHINPQPNHEKIEQALMKDVFGIFRRKWLIEIVQALSTHESLFFNEIKHHLQNISSKTLSKRLSELENEGIITRHVEQGTQPIRVNYFLTSFGKGLYQTIMPFFIYYLTNRPHCSNNEKKGIEKFI